MRQQATCSCTDSSSTTLHLWRIPSPNLNYPKRSRPGSVARADTRKNILERGSVLAVANHWRHEHEGSTRVFRVEMAQKISNRCHTPFGLKHGFQIGKQRRIRLRQLFSSTTRLALPGSRGIAL